MTSGDLAVGMAPIVIVADDLGRDSAVNDAIFEAFATGLISDASVMANMPGFVEACEWVRVASLQGDVGVHLNLTQGMPMTQPIRSEPAFCEPSGEFLPRGRTIWRLTRSQAEAVMTELSAQLDAVLAQGLKPLHLDSHHHSHTQWSIGAILIEIAKRNRIPAVRLSRNCGLHISPMKRAYKAAYNARLARAGLARTDHFGSAADALSMTRITAPIEVMVHPERHPDGRVVDCLAQSRFDDAEPLDGPVDRLKSMGSVVSFGALVADARAGA